MSREALEALISENDEHPRACMKDSDGQYAFPSVRNTYFIWRAARAAALEEAAEVADSHATCEGIGQRIAVEIRALKEPQ